MNNFEKERSDDLETWGLQHPDILANYWLMGEAWQEGYNKGERERCWNERRKNKTRED